MQSNTYCNEAWTTVHYDHEGHLGPCCTFRGGRDPNLKSVNEYLESDWLREVQRKMLNGEQVGGCHHCYTKEAKGESSQRTDRNAQYGFIDNLDIKTVYLSFGNICNKNCNICRPARSSQVAKEYNSLGKDHYWWNIDTWSVPTPKDYSATYLDVLDNYIEAVDHADILYLDGGEPFYTAQCNKILKHLIDTNRTDKFIKATTNASISVEQVEMLSKFRKVELGLSIDGIEDLYSCVRSPHDWNWWNEHHSRIVDANFNRIYLTVAHVFNIHQLPKMVKYFKDNNKQDSQKAFHFSTIVTRPYLGAHVVPRDVLKSVAQELTELLDYNMTEREITNLKNLIKHLTVASKMRNEKDSKNFKKFVELFGPIKGIDYQSHLPWSIYNE